MEKREMHERKKESVSEYNNWLERLPHHTNDELLAHAKSIRQPGIDYFKNQFLNEGGDLASLTKCFKCCNTLFNPLWLKLNHQLLEHIIGIASESLPHFGFPELNENFIERFKNLLKS